MKKTALIVIVCVVAILGWFSTAQATPPGPAVGSDPPAVTDVSAWLNVPCMDRCTGCERCNKPTWGAENHVHFGPLTSANKCVVIAFWNITTPADKITKMNQFWQSNKANVQFIGITILDETQTEEQVRAFVTEKVKFPVGITTNKDLLSAYGATNLPHACLVARNGKVNWLGDPSEPGLGRAVEVATRAPSLPGLPGRR